jgi:soluble P-type ATPase
VTLVVDIPGGRRLELEHLVLDVNGTLSDRGVLLGGIRDRADRLRDLLELHLVSGDTFGTLDALAAELGLPASRIATGEDKLELLERLGRERCAVVGNGTNDALVLEAAALGIAVVGPEGASGVAVRSADVLCRSVLEALDLLLDTRALGATLRP